MKKLKIGLLIMTILLMFSCATTTIHWVPVYEMKSSETRENTLFDPETKSIINPAENVTLAYFKGEDKEAVVYGNNYHFALSNKIVITDGTLDTEQSTAQVVSNLTLTKSFNYPLVTQTMAAAPDPKQELYILQDSNLVVFNHKLLKNQQELEYIIKGENVGTDMLADITVLDVLPRGFKFVSSSYWFSDDNGTFEHQLVNTSGKSALVFNSVLSAPLLPAQSFQIKVKVALQLAELIKEFE